MRLIRFVIGQKHPDSQVEDGVFTAAYALQGAPALGADDRALLTATLSWFEQNLRKPDRFNRSKSKGFYRRKPRGIAWFKDSAIEHLRRMHQLKAILERHDYVVVMLSDTRVGYVVYEDANQIVAEPFSETRTR